ncbi:hypothetical protein Salat_2111100 [Sesamum alatum]|uniref:Reverse transcriptase zinc-binding domain-containing protein n=1 Tax=Sesamum alatum TaxID=300844 RepID=A0AAE1Y0T3_9LAMI|nr:hypothetical protein Salat_2111100 [Sesamum alatum]
MWPLSGNGGTWLWAKVVWGRWPEAAGTFLWKAKLPGKVRVFAWRLCKQALPIGFNLRRRHLQVHDGCPQCFVEVEDVYHVMLGCHFARQTWALTNLPWLTIENWGNNAKCWLRQLHRNVEAWEYGFALVVAWKLWHCHNLVLMENRIRSPWEVAQASRTFLHFLRERLWREI